MGQKGLIEDVRAIALPPDIWWLSHWNLYLLCVVNLNVIAQGDIKLNDVLNTYLFIRTTKYPKKIPHPTKYRTLNYFNLNFKNLYFY